jgi:indole-3-glycerol phosphate synthase
MTILDKLAATTRERVEFEKKALPLITAAERCRSLPLRGVSSFENALRADACAPSGGVSFICEVKKASPSKGVITGDFPYLDIAADYEAAGAAAISVLTEPDFFLGNDRYLEEIAKTVGPPVLRKDFTVDEHQLYTARLLGASAVLLICSLLDSARLRDFLLLAASLGLDCLVEAHDEGEIDSALSAGARVIGVNNRNLKTFEVDLNTSVRLRKLVPPEIVFVAESGIKSRDDVLLLEKNGVDAVLVGETLMRQRDRKAALRELQPPPPQGVPSADGGG